MSEALRDDAATVSRRLQRICGVPAPDRVGADAGVGGDVRPDSGPGIDRGTGVHADPSILLSTDLSTGLNVHAGSDLDPALSTGLGAGLSTGPSTGLSTGPGAGLSTGLGAGPSASLSAGVGAGPSAVSDERAGAEPDSAPAPASGMRRAVGLGGPGAFDPGRRGVRALVVVAVLVLLAAAVFAWRARPRAEPVQSPSAVAPGPAAAPDPASAHGPAAGAPAAAPDAAAPTASGADGELVVAVAGKVRRPGLVRLPAGARVADAIAAAGGALPGTEVSFLNLARKVTDGELILVGVTAPPGVAVGGGDPGGAPGAAGVPGGKVNLNTAPLTQLDGLPGVGPVLAQRIVDHRERHGAFKSVADLRQVDGIGEARFEQLRDLVTV